MTNLSRRRATLVVVFGAFVSLSACGNPTQKFEFTSTTSDLTMGMATFEVRLKNAENGTFVEDALITATGLDMEPDGMKDMKSLLEEQGPRAPGIYRFAANFNMAGHWQLSLVAAVPGQVERVKGTVVFNVN